jgi:hypothetical protein
MSLVAEFTVPAEEFALYETLREVREATVEVERVVAHEAGWIVPYFWVSGGEYAAFESAAADDPSIENLVRLDEVERAALYGGEWIEDSRRSPTRSPRRARHSSTRRDATDSGVSSSDSTNGRTVPGFEPTSRRTA